MNCPVCGRPATHVAFAGFDVYGCALCPASDVNPPVVIANSLTAKRAAASSGGPVLGNEMAFEEMKARYAAVKSEAERDYAGMRRFQVLYIEADQRLRAIQAIVDEQAEDEGLWIAAKYISEEFLQQALRRLHAAVEGKPGTPFEQHPGPRPKTCAEPEDS